MAQPVTYASQIQAQIRQNLAARDQELTSKNQEFKTVLEKLDEEFPLTASSDLHAILIAPASEMLRQTTERSKKLRIAEDKHFEQWTAINQKFGKEQKILFEKLKSANRQVLDEQASLFDRQMSLLSQTKTPLEYTHQLQSMQSQGASPIQMSASLHPITYITIKYDAGYGNTLSICGTGPKMSWDPKKALPLRCVGSDIWVYETIDDFLEFEFKILLNNQVGRKPLWEESPSNHSIHRDKPQQLTPRFLL